MKNNLCENCGHPEYVHGFGKRPCNIEGCTCKKFKAKRRAIALEDAEGYYKSKEKEGTFNLSDEIERLKKSYEIHQLYGEKAVVNISHYIEGKIKEFIKRREEVIQMFLMGEIDQAKMWFELHKLAGKNLT